MFKFNIFLTLILILSAIFAYAAPPQLPRWISLSTDSRDTVREIIRSEVDNREGFSSRQDEKINLRSVENEKEKDDSDYKNLIINANKEFIRAKKKRDDISTQFQTSSTDLDESAKGIKTIRATIENFDAQIDRYQQDTKTQRDSLKRWLQTEKQGEILVAVIYTRGFKDSAHILESNADKSSAPLIAQHMGTFIQSFTNVINNITSVDFIRATEEGTAKWNNEEPQRIELEKGERGTTYLRIKRYELYPFKENKAGKIKPVAPSAKFKVVVINSRKDLDAFLIQNQYAPRNYELNRIDSLIKDTTQSNAVAEEGLNEQVKSFQEKISNLQDKIRATTEEKESQKLLLKRKEETYYKMSLDVAAIREQKDKAEKQFRDAQTALQEKKRTHESIIIKTALATTKGSQTPAEASAEAILDKLDEVKNDAKTQHTSSTTEVTNFQVTAESSTQSITEARIIAARLISFINEGDSVRVNMAFRVRTVLEDRAESEGAGSPDPDKIKTSEAYRKNYDSLPEVKPRSTVEPPQEKGKTFTSFQRNYRFSDTKEALGCLFDLRSVHVAKDGLHIMLEVINKDAEVRSVAFYDERFGRWTKSRIYDEANKYYDTTSAYIIRDNQKTLMYDIDSRGRGIAIKPQTSMTMELIFTTVPPNTRNVKINLHPFIYYPSGRSQTWQEFDLVIPGIRLYDEARNLKPAAESSTTPDQAPLKKKRAKKKKPKPNPE